MIRFGPAGNSDSFYEQGNKSSVAMPQWLRRMGLNAYEYQCNKGVNIKEQTARKIGGEALVNDIYLSIHAPYYINLCNEEESSRIRSVKYIIDAMTAASWMGAGRVVIHIGSCSGMDRKKAFEYAADSIRLAIAEARERGLDGIAICPETLGKINQFGTLEEIVELCRISEQLIPTLDLGHLYARQRGNLNSVSAFETVMDVVENALGTSRLSNIHCHFSKIEYTAGGERRHVMLEDEEYGPEFEYVARVFARRRMEPVVICESRFNMAEQALLLKQIYENIANE